MVEMMDIQNAKDKIDFMLFMKQFQFQFDEINDQIEKISAACTEVRSSSQLRKLMAIILTLGNQINTGGDGNIAIGFSLDALLKLDKAKTFDKKTNVLQYLVKLVKQNDKSLLDFKKEISSVENAKKIGLQATTEDFKKLNE